MTRTTAASISRNILEVKQKLPNNAWIVACEIELNRTTMDDRPYEIMGDFPMVFMSEPKPYIKPHVEKFTFPLYYNGGKTWPQFAGNLQSIVEWGIKYDPKIADKMYLSNVVLAQIPIDYVTKEMDSSTPLDDDNKLYDGIPLSFFYFCGTDKYLNTDLGCLSPGSCTKTADLVKVELTKTKRARGDLIKRKDVRCWLTKDIHVIDGKQLRNPTPDYIKSLMPSLWNTGLIQIRECNGSYKESTTFLSETCKRLSVHEDTIC
jgi:hypothetical protein